MSRANPQARPYREMVGEVVLKHFEGHGVFMGTIIEYDEQTGFRLQFDDGDTEDVSLRDLVAFLPTTHPEYNTPPPVKPKQPNQYTKRAAPTSEPTATPAGKTAPPASKSPAASSRPTPAVRHAAPKGSLAETSLAAPKKEEASAGSVSTSVAPPPRKKMLLEQTQQQVEREAKGSDAADGAAQQKAARLNEAHRSPRGVHSCPA